MKIEYTGNIQDVLKGVKHIMINKDITRKDICNVTGWAPQTVSNLLAGRTANPGINVILTLCNAVGCKLVLDVIDVDNK